MSIYHQEREMILNDITCRRKKDDISIYHVSSRDMIYRVASTMIHNDTQ